MNTKIYITPHTQKNLISFIARPLVWVVLCSITVLTAMPVAAAPFAYLANDADPGIVSVIDTATNTLVDTVTVGSWPEYLAITPDGKRVYVTNLYPTSIQSGPSTVSVIDTATNKVVATVNVGVNPAGVAVAPDGKHVYVANYWTNSISVIDTATNNLVDTIWLGLPGGGPQGVVVTPNGKRLYVTNYYESSVWVIDTSTNTVVNSVNVGISPYILAVAPDGKHVYVPNNLSDSVSVIDTATNTVVSTVSVGSGPVTVALTPDGKHIYVTNVDSNSVSVIDAATNTVMETVSVADLPRGVAITPDGKRAYVAKYNSGYVSVIDTAINKVVDTVYIGDVGANSVAITPLPTAVSFSSFRIKHLLIDRHHESLFLLSHFTIGESSNGINPTNETVTLKIGNVTMTIPAGSFHKHRHGVFTFVGQIDNMSIEAHITPLDRNRFGFEAAAYDADVSGIKNPVAVELTIGNDSGVTSVEAIIKRRRNH